MKTLSLLLFAALLAACETTPKIDDPIRQGDEVTISGDDLEPVANFFFQTKRILVAEFIKVEMTPQFFEEKMGLTRDPRYVEKKMWTGKDGTRYIEIRNINTVQKTNLDPDLLPRIYFGEGFEARAYNTIIIMLKYPKTRERPLFLEVTAKNSTGDAKLWVGGRLQQQRPTIVVRSELIWHEGFEHYKHRSHIG